jgi:hypothetical protein
MYGIRTQIQLVFALMAVHNFMNSHSHNPEAEGENLECEGSEEAQPSNIRVRDDTTMTAWCDEIAKITREDYRAYQGHV